MRADYDGLANRILTGLPDGPELVVIGSTSFWHTESEATCVAIGRMLAEISGLILITGGVEGVGETVGRSFFQARNEAGVEPRVFHLLPHGEDVWDYGETMFAGRDMLQRREVLARLSLRLLAIEGGPGTVHEACVALARRATVVPVGRTGGHAGELYLTMDRPRAIDVATWATLGDTAATPEIVATAAVRAIQALL